MKLTLKRKALRDNYTIGDLYINGVFFCNTLEDKVRDLSQEAKVYAETAIPYGTYKIIMNQSPKFSPRYGGRNVPRLLDVPHFEGILIHTGNTAKDTSGCILVGENTVVGKVLNSTVTFNKLCDILDKVPSYEEIIIEIE